MAPGRVCSVLCYSVQRADFIYIGTASLHPESQSFFKLAIGHYIVFSMNLSTFIQRISHGTIWRIPRLTTSISSQLPSSPFSIQARKLVSQIGPRPLIMKDSLWDWSLRLEILSISSLASLEACQFTPCRTKVKSRRTWARSFCEA